MTLKQRRINVFVTWRLSWLSIVCPSTSLSKEFYSFCKSSLMFTESVSMVRSIGCHKHLFSQQEKTYLLACAQWRLKSACASVQIRLWSPHDETAYLGIQNAPSKDSDQTVWIRGLICIISMCACPKVRYLTFRKKLSYCMAIWFLCCCMPVQVIDTKYKLFVYVHDSLQHDV